MALQFSNAASQARVGSGSVIGLGGYAGANAYFVFYVGAQAAGGPESGTLPAGTQLNDSTNAPVVTSWTNTGNGVLTANISATPGKANLSAGTSACFVMFTSAGATVCSGTVGTSASDINFNTNVFALNAAISLTSFSITYAPH